MKQSKNYYRVRLLVRIAFWSALVIGIYVISTHLWWTGNGYCFGDMITCDLGGK